jgi:hypothetical protein
VNTAAGYRSVVEASIPLVIDAEVIRGYPAAVTVVDSDTLSGVDVVCAGGSPAAATRSTAKAGASLAGGGVVIRDPLIAVYIIDSGRPPEVDTAEARSRTNDVSRSRPNPSWMTESKPSSRPHVPPLPDEHLQSPGVIWIVLAVLRFSELKNDGYTVTDADKKASAMRRNSDSNVFRSR